MHYYEFLKFLIIPFFLPVSLVSSSPSNNCRVENIIIGLKQQNIDTLYETFHNVSNPDSSQYGKFWTQNQINNLVAPPQEQIDDLLIYMKKKGISCKFKGSDALTCKGVDPYSLYDLRNQNIFKVIDFVGLEMSSNRDMMPYLFSPHSVGDGDG